MKLMFNKIFKNYFLISVTLFLSEMIFRVILGLSLVDWSVLRILIGVNLIGLIFGLIFSFCGRKLGNLFSFIISLLFVSYSFIQLSLFKYLGSFVSFNLIGQFDAVKDFVNVFFSSINLVNILVFLPLLILLVYYIYVDEKLYIMEMNHMIDFSDKFHSLERKEMNDSIKNKKRKRLAFGDKIASVVIAGILIGIYAFTLMSPIMQNNLQYKTNLEFLNSPDTPNIVVSQFGFTGYSLLDAKDKILPSNTRLNSKYTSGYNIPEQSMHDFTRYIDDTLWKQIINDEANRDYKTLSNYYISKEITDKNDYTGIFEDKNLIVIMAESVNNLVINEKYYPNIYKLYSDGWAFDNAYSPRSICAGGNSEYAGLTSVYGMNNKCVNDYKFNKNNYSLFGLFNNNDYSTSSYHNYTDKYYSRGMIHPNLGSGHYYGVQELGIPYSNLYNEWPSDVALMNKVLENTKDEDRFMSFITTVSSSMPYDINSELGQKYFDLFSDSGYNMELKRYMSKLKVLDDAIGVLINGLEEQGKLDDTVIIIYSDHYPYGLDKDVINDQFEYDVNLNREIDRTPFIIYNSKITASKYEEYVTYMDLVPTLGNLFGFEYDPRLYSGSDVFSNSYDNRIIFNDGSWQDDKAYYDAMKGKITYYNSGERYSDEELDEITEDVRNNIYMSNLAIKTNYFNYLYNKFEEYKVETVHDVTTSN